MRRDTPLHDIDQRSGTDRRLLSRRNMLTMAAGGAAASAIPAWSYLGPAQQDGWSVGHIPSQRGRVALVTGGNGFPSQGRSGLGYHTALALARAGAEVTIASRNRPRGEEAVRRIGAAVPGAAIRFETLDLASLSSVRAFAARLAMQGKPLDLLINNAGVMGRATREFSVDAVERVFATNTLGHFALTGLLLPLLQQAGAARVVWVSSMRVSKSLPRFPDLRFASDYDYAAAYNHSKLANLMLALELHRRSKAEGWNVTSLASHPGVARTNLIPDGPGLESAEGWRFRNLPFLFQAADQGALPSLYAATASESAGGGYFGPAGLGGMRGSPGIAEVPEAARDERAAATLWASLERLSGVSFG